MYRPRPGTLAGVLLTALLSVASPLRASTGVCDSNPPTSTQACVDAIQAGGSVVNDIFKDANGLEAKDLPVFAKLFNRWPNCPKSVPYGCAGTSKAPYDCPGQYDCPATTGDFALASQYLNKLDRTWWQPYRHATHPALGDCPNFGNNIADGDPTGYFPWEGLIFDLGGPSNQVAIFAENDHGPQPCESVEYTVFLTDDPFALDTVMEPKKTGIDPKKWNRAVLSKIFTEGFIKVRPQDTTPNSYGANCGDTALYSVEEDSFVSVYSLPCGVTFRYAAIVSGNDGLDFKECAFHSNEAELDAVAGLTESGAAVCPDADGDLFVDCNCPGAPPVCDCNDGNPAVHPGAPEACDAPDLNCDGAPGSCSGDLVCFQSICVATCSGENLFCPAGTGCTQTPQGNLCVPQDCSAGGCPAGLVCSNNVCVPACTDVVCPGTQVCKDGQCIDPCQGVQCPSPQVCQAGKCVSPCACFNGDSGCVDFPGTVCDKGNTNICVEPACQGKNCALQGQTCNPINGMCEPFCNPSVKCPMGQHCVDPTGCVPLCEGVSCPQGEACDPMTGICKDVSCDNVTCLEPLVCVMGACVDPGTGAGGMGGAGGGAGGMDTTTSAGGAGGKFQPTEKSGCGCRTAGDPESPLGGAAALAGLAALGVIARRRRR